MKIHELTIPSQKSAKRVGRGIGSGIGKTAGRGTKGQNSRSGGGVRPGFEGGQNPLAKRIPKKRGFVPLSRTIFQTVSLTQLDGLSVGTITNDIALKAGLIKSLRLPVKVLGTGKLTKKQTVRLQAATTSAKQAIVAAGGTFEASNLVKAKPKSKAEEA